MYLNVLYQDTYDMILQGSKRSSTLMSFILKESVYSFEYRHMTSSGHKMHKENKPNLVYCNDNNIFL